MKRLLLLTLVSWFAISCSGRKGTVDGNPFDGELISVPVWNSVDYDFGENENGIIQNEMIMGPGGGVAGGSGGASSGSFIDVSGQRIQTVKSTEWCVTDIRIESVKDGVRTEKVYPFVRDLVSIFAVQTNFGSVDLEAGSTLLSAVVKISNQCQANFSVFVDNGKSLSIQETVYVSMEGPVEIVDGAQLTFDTTEEIVGLANANNRQQVVNSFIPPQDLF